MNAKDLMIGDWIHRCYTCSDTGREVVIDFQLTEIRNLAKSLYVCSEKGVVCKVEDAEPIPLTPEILEKNGFKFDGSGQCSMMFISEPHFSEGQRFNIYVGLKHKTIDVFVAHPIEKSPNWRKSNKVCLEVCGCYVHELQHALRLCGIDKDLII